MQTLLLFSLILACLFSANLGFLNNFSHSDDANDEDDWTVVGNVDKVERNPRNNEPNFTVGFNSNDTNETEIARIGHFSLVNCNVRQGHVLVCDFDRVISLPENNVQINDQMRFYIGEQHYKVGGESINDENRNQNGNVSSVANQRKVCLRISFVCAVGRECPQQQTTCDYRNFFSSRDHKYIVAIGFQLGAIFVFAFDTVRMCIFLHKQGKLKDFIRWVFCCKYFEKIIRYVDVV